MTRVISFSSGKGGVGKTNLVVNLGFLLAKKGKKVLLIDGDWALGKLGLMLNVRPTWTVEKVLSEEIRLSQAITPVAPNLSLLASPSGLVGFEEMNEATRNQLFFEIETLANQYDYILFDHSSGIHWGVLQFAAASHQHVIVTTCEPTSYTDAYAIMKILSKRFSIRDFCVVATMSHSALDTEKVLHRFGEVVRTQLGVGTKVLEIFPWDMKVGESVRKQVPFIELYPKTDLTTRFERLADRLERTEVTARSGLNFFYSETISL